MVIKRNIFLKTLHTVCTHQNLVLLIRATFLNRTNDIYIMFWFVLFEN